MKITKKMSEEKEKIEGKLNAFDLAEIEAKAVLVLGKLAIPKKLQKGTILIHTITTPRARSYRYRKEGLAYSVSVLGGRCGRLIGVKRESYFPEDYGCDRFSICDDLRAQVELKHLHANRLPYGLYGVIK